MSTRVIELYSGRRNRLQYPNPASFEVPFAAVQTNAPNPEQSIDPVCNGGIYYTFTLYSQKYPYIYGTFKEGSNQYQAFLNFDIYDQGNSFKGFYNGYLLVDTTSGESHSVRNFDPSTAGVTFDNPFTAPITPGNNYYMYAGYPNKYSVFIPALDNNGNSISPAELAYNGNHVIFETPNPHYSNPQNSNIFYRQISYYDSINQIAYFNDPLPFDYTDTDQNQTFTLRKIPPSERWTLDTPSYFNRIPPANPEIGPLLGDVIVLPEGANPVNNFYKGKFVYFSSNVPQAYTPPLPPRSQLEYPIPNIFYPIYGLFYIKAYNASTRELSIRPINENELNTSSIPTYGLIPEIDSSSFYLSDENFSDQTNFIDIQNVGGTTYRATTNPTVDFTSNIATASMSLNLEPGTYQFSWTIRRSETILDNFYSGWVGTYGFTSEWYTPYNIPTDYTTFTFVATTQPGIKTIVFQFHIQMLTTEEQGYFEWSDLTVTRVDSINILNYKYDNFSPLDYNGSIVSQNQASCYQITLDKIILPNKPLKTGSRIAFYPYIYVEFTDATSPTNASNTIIISNNPNSKRSLFTIAVPQVSSPADQAFVTLTGGTSQIVKFKPNDNLKFSVYLPDGTLFTTLVPDSFSPYEPDPTLQIDATFSYHKI